MTITLWVLQVLLAVAFFAHGWLLLAPPPEIAAVGLTLPGLTRIMPWL